MDYETRQQLGEKADKHEIYSLQSEISRLKNDIHNYKDEVARLNNSISNHYYVISQIIDIIIEQEMFQDNVNTLINLKNSL